MKTVTQFKSIKFFYFFIILSFSFVTQAQTIEDWTYTPITTDNNMSIVFPAGTLDDFTGGELMAFNDGGHPISSSSIIAADGSGGIAAIGTDALCDCDYLSGGDNISFAILINGNIIVVVDVNPPISYAANTFMLIDYELTFNCPDIDIYYNCNGVCINDSDGDEVCDELEISGCLDSLACNYNVIATEDDLSCIYDVDALEYYDCFGFCLSDSDNDGICDELEVIGCTEEWADNYDENATDHDESCYRMGCVSQWADNFDPLATINDSSCFRIGCSDSTMFNYDSLATDDDGSCIPFIEGCIDTLALNFDSLANTDNETCIFPLSFSGSGDLTFNFTNCEQEGRYGPDQSQVNNVYTGSSLEGQVISNDGIQEWLVPYSGIYSIEVSGAQGGYSTYGYTGGYGAMMSGEVFLESGQLIQILVGQQGGQSGQRAAGGGGGSFVAYNNTPIIVSSGGSGGGGNNYSGNGQPGLIGNDGGNGSYDYSYGGTNGFGGYTSSSSGSGGAGGFYGAGGSGYGSTHGVGFLSGGSGGSDGCGNGGYGGFGGGAGGEWCSQGASGPGGGYSGGAGTGSSGVAGGGGSFNAGENQDNIAGINEGHGQVTITFIGTLCSDPLALNAPSIVGSGENDDCLYPGSLGAVSCMESDLENLGFNSFVVEDSAALINVSLISDIQYTVLSIFDANFELVDIYESTQEYDFEPVSFSLDTGVYYTGVSNTSFDIPYNTLQELFALTDPISNPQTVLVNIVNECEDYGCTNPIACNFDEQALIDDKSCEFAIQGEPGLSTFDDIVIYLDDYAEFTSVDFLEPELIGLCNNLILGYNLTCNYASGDLFPLGVTPIVYTSEIDGNVYSSVFNITIEVQGCTSYNAYNYDPLATLDDGSCDYWVDYGTLNCGETITSLDTISGQYNNSGNNFRTYSFEIENNNTHIETEFDMYVWDCNYNCGAEMKMYLFKLPETIFESVTLIESYSFYSEYYEWGYTSGSLPSSFDLNAGSYVLIYGGENYNESWTNVSDFNDAYNYFTNNVYNDNEDFNLSIAMTAYDGSCDMPGCTDYTSLSYDSDATIDDGSCYYATEIGTLVCAEEYSSPEVIIEGGSEYNNTSDLQFDAYSFEIDSNNTLLNLTYHIDDIEGCYYDCNSYARVLLFNEDDLIQDWYHSVYYNYNNEHWNYDLTLDAGNYTIIYGNSGDYYQGDSSQQDAVEYFENNSNSSENWSFSIELAVSTEYCTPGCTDEVAFNYNADATEDNGSCRYATEIGPLGCAEEYASPEVIIEGGSEYDDTSDLQFDAYSFEIDSNNTLLNLTYHIDDIEGCYYDCNSYARVLLFNEDDLIQDWYHSVYYSYNNEQWDYDLTLDAGNYTIIYGNSGDYYQGYSSKQSAVEYFENNYNSSENWSFSLNLIEYDLDCQESLSGCMDELADNYNPESIYEGDCMYYGCTDILYIEFNPIANVDDQSCNVLVVPGCMDILACNYDSIVNTNDGSCQYSSPEEECESYCDADENLNNICDSTEIAGCLDEMACNYNEIATLASDDCEYIQDSLFVIGDLIYECYLNFTSSSSCTSPDLVPGNYILELSGTWCGGSCWGGNHSDAAFNINPDPVPITSPWTWNEYCPQGDNTCQSYRPIVDEHNEENTYHYLFQSTGGAETIYGVSDECCWGDNSGGLTVKIYSNTLTDCEYCSGETDGTGTIITSIDSDYDSVCDEQDLFPNDPLEWSDNDGDGVGDNSDCNNDDASIYLDSDDDSVCDEQDLFPNDPLEWSDLDGDGVGDNSDYCPDDSGAWNDTDGDGVCDNNEIIGCTEDWADNYDQNATDHDESCYKMGCVLEWADNFDLLATIDDSSCFRLGCTDSTMFNYDSLATDDDGSCIPFIEGCIDPIAFNYDSLANTDNETCIIPLSFSGDLTLNFTNCEQEGRFGPDQSQVNNEYSGTSLEGEVTSNDGIQEWLVPYSGIYSIEVSGAQGGYSGGFGAFMSGDFYLNYGELINVVVGQQGVSPYENSCYSAGGGGGGGSFVYTSETEQLLICSGGGAGVNECDSYNTSLDAITLINSENTCSGYNGHVGNCGYYDGSGPGAGWLSGDDFLYSSDDVVGAKSRPTWVGGASNRHSDNAHGGFGGGGASIHPGGGGGGYSGGAAGYNPSGGGSYNAGENQDNIAGINEGHGQVTITFIGTLCSDPLALNAPSIVGSGENDDCLYPGSLGAVSCMESDLENLGFNSFVVEDSAALINVSLISDIQYTVLSIFDANFELVDIYESTQEYDFEPVSFSLDTGVYYTGVSNTSFDIPYNTLQELFALTDPISNPQTVLVNIVNECEDYGCTNPIACNFDEQALIDDKSCEFAIQGEPGLSTFDDIVIYLDDYAEFTSVDFLEPELIGLCNNLILGYNLTCNYASGDLFPLGVTPIVYTSEIDGNVYSSVFNITIEVQGCTSYNAYNYDPLATLDDGSCDYWVDYGTLNCGETITSLDTISGQYNNSGNNFRTYSFEIENNNTHIETEFDMDLWDCNWECFSEMKMYLFKLPETMFEEVTLIESYSYWEDYWNYSEESLPSSFDLNAGSYVLIYGGVNYNESWTNVSDFSDAYNYFTDTVQNDNEDFSLSIAMTAHDGSCDWPGCIDPISYTFNPFATIDDGTCDYDTELGVLECGVNYSSGLDTLYGMLADQQLNLWDTYNFSLDSQATTLITLDMNSWFEGDTSSYVAEDNNATALLFENDSLIQIWYLNSSVWGATSWESLEIELELIPGDYTLVYGNNIEEWIYYGMNLDEAINAFETYYNHYWNNYFTMQMSLLLYDGSCDMPGCTDYTSLSYNSDATIDDGSCYYATEIGTLVCAEEYSSPEVIIEGGLEYNNTSDLQVDAYNFEIDSNNTLLNLTYHIDDIESCYYSCYSYARVLLFSEDSLIQDWYHSVYYSNNNEQWDYDLTLDAGNYTIIYGNSGDYNQGYSSQQDAAEYFQNNSNSSENWSFSMELAVSTEYCTPGCTDSTAYNYDFLATVDDGSCIFEYYNIANDNEISTCGGVLFDSGGPDGNYVDYENHSIVIYPENEGEYVSLYFDAFQLEGCCDYVTIYDGASTSSPILVPSSNGTSLAGQTFYASVTNETGALTVTFTSDGSVTYLGWVAEIGCTTYGPCDGIYLDECATCLDGIVTSNDSDQDGVCDADEISGCWDEIANNFNPWATDSTTCCYGSDLLSTVNISTNIWADEISWGITDTDNETILESENLYSDSSLYTFSVCLGSNETYSFNMYDSYYDGWNGASYSIESVCGVLNSGTLETGGFQQDEFETCTSGCTDSLYVEYSPIAYFDDGSCETFIVLGCTDTLACNYDLNSTMDDGSCYTVVDLYYDCQGNCLIDSDGDGVCDELEITGCIDDLACNYDPSATQDGVCQYPEEYYDCEGNCLIYSDADGICDELEITGCIDALACNYDPSATQDGICQYPEAYYDCNNVCLNDVDSDGICDELEVDGCTDQLAFNYDDTATDDDGSCQYTCSLPSSWEYELTGLNHTLMIPEDVSIDVNGQLLTQGSSIGVFYTNENGEIQCAGYTSIIGETTFIAVMGDDSTTDQIDGLQEGQEFIWMVWDILTCEQYELNPSYSVGPSIFTANGLTYLDALEHYTCQQVELPGGWFMYSSYIQADDMDVELVMSPIADNLVILKANDGNVYMPEYGFNGIGDLDFHYGYQIKTNTSETLEICGLKMHPEEQPIALQSGWNMVSYLRETSAPADVVLADLTDNDNLAIVKDYNGNPYLPEWDFNGIGDMLSGQGYQLKIYEADTLIYLSNDQQYRISTSQVIENSADYFSKVTPTGNNMHIVIPQDAWDVIPEIGSEIAAYNSDGILVGSAKYSNPTTVLTLWGDDITTKTIDGLLVDEPVLFKVWNKEQLRGLRIENWSAGSNAYQIDAIHVAAAVEIENFTQTTNLFDAIPNPSQTKTNISFFVAEAGKVNISVYNVVGELVEVLANSFYKSGTHQLEMQVSHIEAGSYLYTMRAGEYEKTKQLIILK